MVIRDITNQSMYKKDEHGFDRFKEDLEIEDGYIVSRLFPAAGFSDKDGNDVSAWLPDIVIVKPNDEVVKVNGRHIAAVSPAEVIHFCFTPAVEGGNKAEETPFYVFKDAFESENHKGDVYIMRYDMTGECDGHIAEGSIWYSGIENRDVTLHGSGEDLIDMFKKRLTKFQM